MSFLSSRPQIVIEAFSAHSQRQQVPPFARGRQKKKALNSDINLGETSRNATPQHFCVRSNAKVKEKTKKQRRKRRAFGAIWSFGCTPTTRTPYTLFSHAFSIKKYESWCVFNYYPLSTERQNNNDRKSVLEAKMFVLFSLSHVGMKLERSSLLSQVTFLQSFLGSHLFLLRLVHL